jgi:hypothetical protein
MSETNLHEPKIKIEQPDGIRYMIQKYHYTHEHAQTYIDMLISKMENYIVRKRKGEFVAPLMTLNQMEIQLDNMRKFKIVIDF